MKQPRPIHRVGKTSTAQRLRSGGFLLAFSMRQRIEIADVQRQQAWEIYARQPDKHLPDIQAFLGVSAGTFVRLRQRWGWPPRQTALNENALSKAAKDEGGIAGLAKAAAASVNDAARALAQNALSKAAKDEGGVAGIAKAAAASVNDAARALAQATRVQIDALMDEQRTGRARDHDKTARRLASYAKTLAAARALLEQESSSLDGSEPTDHKPRRSLHELREELARHLDRVVAEEEARGRDGLLV